MRNNYRSFILLVAGVFLIFCTPACAADDLGLSPEERVQKAKEYHIQGREFMQKDDFTSANNAFKKAQELLVGAEEPKPTPLVSQETSPVSQEPALISKITHEEVLPQEFGSRDVNYYIKALETDPANPDIYYNLALEYLRNNQYKLASDAFFRVITLNPKDAEAYYNLGVLAESYFNDKKQAMNFYAKYIEFTAGKEEQAEVKLWIKRLKKDLKNDR
ncbi:MAG: tetratricopeptide repeat protein [Candidatus Omnitrophota bacterium]|nr:tetratricopeptide repeat protein [Candidatus Omnitrophota bacterium]